VAVAAEVLRRLCLQALVMLCTHCSEALVAELIGGAGRCTRQVIVGRTGGVQCSTQNDASNLVALVAHLGIMRGF
jgi:hypothetical protein